MTGKFIALGALAISLSIAPVYCQTAAEQLQKAIYTQEAGGDLDTAIQIYRQIAYSSPDHREIAAQAQLRLAQSLLQKGKLDEAAIEFGNLARNYADYGGLIAAMSASRRGLAPAMSAAQPSITQGTLQNGRYHHNPTGVEFLLSPGWNLLSDGPSSGDGAMAILADADSKIDFAAVWMKHYDKINADIPGSLRGDMKLKITQRTDFKGYKIRPESIQPETIGGQQALSAVADYQENDINMVEYLTWVRGPKVLAFFFSRMAAADFPAFRSRFDQIIQSAYVPQN